jgi:hypothetical protein
MPRGTEHDEIGRLNEIGGQFSLRRDGGGTWRLDCSGQMLRRARELAGARVRVSGVRDGFDLLSVRSIEETPS